MKARPWNEPGNSCLFWRKRPGRVIADAGYDYDVEISLCNMYFTTRFYDGVNGGESVTLPAGMYDAVRIVIGEGAGRNWWCVVFPPLCVSAAQESGDSATLDDVLDPEQEEIVTEPGKYEVRFKIVEIFEDLCHRISGWFGQPESTRPDLPQTKTFEGRHFGKPLFPFGFPASQDA